MHRNPCDLGTKPFLKYAGSKRRLLPQLLPHLPLRGRLVEPFVGAGSVFLGSDYSRYLLNDANPDLVAMWTAIKERPREYANQAAAFFQETTCSETAYAAIRREFNETNDRYERALRLPYLNKHGFNGLFRTNSKGDFNVPWGCKKVPPAFPWEEIALAAKKLERCSLLSGDFSIALEMSGFGDAVYCDPPYLASEEGLSFTGYTRQGFSLHDQVRLVKCARLAAERGATVLISNHDTELARKVYEGFEIHSLSVRRSIAATCASRGDRHELLAILRPR